MILDELTAAYQTLLASHTRLQGEVAATLDALRKYAVLPFGSIMPYFGNPALLDGTGWFPCTKENHDRDPRIPNLEAQFLMGAQPHDLGRTGGRERLEAQGGHDHGGTTGTVWYKPGEINWDRIEGRPDDWSHRHSIDGVGNHDHGAQGDLRPPFTTVCYIIRVESR